MVCPALSMKRPAAVTSCLYNHSPVLSPPCRHNYWVVAFAEQCEWSYVAVAAGRTALLHGGIRFRRRQRCAATGYSSCLLNLEHFQNEKTKQVRPWCWTETFFPQTVVLSVKDLGGKVRVDDGLAAIWNRRFGSNSCRERHHALTT